MKDRDDKGRITTGREIGRLPPKPGKRVRGRPKKGEESDLMFIDGLFKHRFKTYEGWWLEVEPDLRKCTPEFRNTFRLRILELKTKADLRRASPEGGISVNLVLHGLETKIREIEGNVITPSLAALPSGEDYEE